MDPIDDTLIAALKKTPEHRKKSIALTRRYGKLFRILPHLEDYDIGEERDSLETSLLVDALNKSQLIRAELDRIQAEINVVLREVKTQAAADDDAGPSVA